MKQIMYNVDHLTLEEKKEICHLAYDLHYRWWTDKLENSFRREKTELSFDDVMSLLTNKSHFVCVNRWDYVEEKFYGEIGFSTTTDQRVDFLWVEITHNNFLNIVSTYNLEPK